MLPNNPMHSKYFIAIVLQDNLLEKAEGLKHELFNKHGLKGALRSPAHITLHRPFEWKTEKENILIETLKQFSFTNKFTVDLNNFNCFEPRVIYIDVMRNEKLYDLHDKLTKFCKLKLKLFNEADDERGFKPHITIAFRDLKKPLFYKLWDEFKNKKFSESLPVTRFSLLRLDEKWDVIADFNI